MIKGFCCLKLAQKPFTVLRSSLGEESPTDAFRCDDAVQVSASGKKIIGTSAAFPTIPKHSFRNQVGDVAKGCVLRTAT